MGRCGVRALKGLDDAVRQMGCVFCVKVRLLSRMRRKFGTCRILAVRRVCMYIHVPFTPCVTSDLALFNINVALYIVSTLLVYPPTRPLSSLPRPLSDCRLPTGYRTSHGGSHLALRRRACRPCVCW